MFVCFFLQHNLGRSSAEWLEPVGDKASKKMLGGAQPGFVYLITMTNAPLGHEKVKIGYSADPDTRRTQLQVGNPWSLEVSDSYPVNDMEAAEAAAQHAMRAHWFRGEWYDFPPYGISSVRRIVSTAIGPYKTRKKRQFGDIPRKNV